MSNSSSSKKPKLDDLNRFRRKLPHLSASASRAVLEAAAEDGLPELSSRKDLAQATAHIMQETTPYGSLLVDFELETLEGAPITVLAVNPFAYLYKAYAQGGAFCNFLAARLKDQSPSLEAPWRLALYSDEVVPGNVLATDNLRKCWVIYVSFLDYGPLALQREESWMCLLAIRSSRVQNIAGGISAVFGSVIKLLHGKLGCNLATGGLLL